MRPAAPADRTPEVAEPEEGPPEKKYDSLPVDELLKKQDGKIRAMLKEGKFASSQSKLDFDKFYQGYFLARWSVQADVKNLPTSYRRDLFNHYRIAKSGEVHDHLNDLVFDLMKKLVAGNYHPAVKVNAMLMIGELNQAEQLSSREAVVPWPKALTALTAAAENSKLFDGLRAAAMIGILRHASAGTMVADEQKKLINAMLRLAAADLPPGSAPSGRAWIAAQAIEILGILGSVGENNEVFKSLLQIVGDAKLPLLVRTAAADAMGRLNYASAAGINPVEAAAALGQFAIDACTDGMRLAKRTDPLDLRRRMLHRLDAALAAIGEEDAKDHRGITSLAKEPGQKAILAEFRKTVKTAADVLDDSRKKDDDMKPVVTELQKSIEAWLPKKP